MATQAVISLVKKDHTFIKIVCGCNGYNAEKLVKIIEDKQLDKIRHIYNAAIENNIGCKECLVVMDDNDIIFKGNDDVDPLYRETFDNPSFNPRWKNGTAEYVIVIKIDNPELIE
jgi:NAD(P)H-nitrite reductase large subunit